MSTVEAFAAEIGATDPVAVEGGRTRWNHAGSADPTARVVRAPAGVTDYTPAEMTVRVLAGTPVADLHATLAEAGQRTALPERGGTVGGAIAVGENHLETLGRGPVRNALLQIRYVSAEGEIVTGGGPTVKNVTGFNMPKLMVGSVGALGALAEATLRTNPIPPAAEWVAAQGVDPFTVPDVLLRPAAVLWDGATTWVKLEGHAADVDAERRRLDALGHFETTTRLPALPEHRWSLAPADLRSLTNEVHGAFVASIGVGTVFASNPQPHRQLPPEVLRIHSRMKQLFDPTGRMNPGRNPAAI